MSIKYESSTPYFSSAGTTCLVALLSDRELTVANVGDSRGVLCDKDGNAVALSHDHKPYQLKERKRIKRAGVPPYFSELLIIVRKKSTGEYRCYFEKWK